MQAALVKSGLLVLQLVAFAATAVAECPCGYREDASNDLFTESIIVYFNESEAVAHTQEVFDVLTYEDKSNKGWDTIYRQGATISNAGIGNTGALAWQDYIDGTSPSLELFVDPSTKNHLVDGGRLRSIRRDILYGSFRASLRSPQPWAGGSALSMALAYNSSNSLELDMLNQEDPSDAYVSQMINGEAATYALGLNYTYIPEPWDFVDVRFDWKKTSVDFWIGSNRTRSVTKANRTLPSVPQPLELRHWSDGDVDYMGGPPTSRSLANVRFVRAFFNSSLMTESEHKSFDERCNASMACSIDDHSLRGWTSYPEAATVPWVQPKMDSHIRRVAGIVAGCFSVFGVLSIINAMIRRTPWHKLKKMGVVGKSEKEPRPRQDSISVRATLQNAQPQWNAVRRKSGADMPPDPSRSVSSRGVTPAPSYHSLSHFGIRGNNTPHTITPLPSYKNLREGHSRNISEVTSSSEGIDTSNGLKSRSSTPAGQSDSPQKSSHPSFFSAAEDTSLPPRPQYATVLGRMDTIKSISADGLDDGIAPDQLPPSRMPPQEAEERDLQKVDTRPSGFEKVMANNLVPEPASVQEAMTTTMASVPKTAPGTAAPNAPTQKIDYLAGFLALSCILVTLRHGSLTFWPYVTEGYGFNRHFAADSWLFYILGPWVLTPMWIGPFFVTSCRFLVARYLKSGKLSDIANKVLLRGPRMLIPCFIFMLVEYFLLSLGATAWLEWLPSISWSTWPYVAPQTNFGVWLNQAVELAYIIPNGVPAVVNNYCVGVLWTIPVQHFYSYVTLLAAVMVRDIKKPWKRLLLYGLTILAGWYALSWSACHWVGLFLADWDISYGMYNWIRAKPYRLYPILTAACLVAIGAPAMDLSNSVTTWDFMGYEYAIHPNAATGRPLLIEDGPVYPNYNYPTLAILLFSGSLQMVVETSTWVQWFLSLKCFTVLHPHVMTIYLLHGFVFWSLGSLVAVNMAIAGLPYWAVLLITALLCYTVIIGASIFIVTPLIEFATQSAMKNIWRCATEEPVPHRPTTAPFPKSLIVDRNGEEEEKHEA